MKLIIQIPCYNEEQTLPVTLKDLPKRIDGVDAIEVLIIDDGSEDRTSEVAKQHGVNHLVRLKNHQGLAQAFAAGLDACLRLGADIVVNTDADNQYQGRAIAQLVAPILQRTADMVIGARDIENIEHFSPMKKFLQRLGSLLVRTVSQTAIPDTTSGFRAYSRDAALRLNVLSDFSYTLETIIQAGTSGLAIACVPIQTNKPLRESRLFSSTAEYLGASIMTIIRVYTMYKPLKFFWWIGGTVFALGAMLVLRFLYFYFTLAQVQTGHVQSLIVAGVLLIIGFQIFLFGLLADITAKNRKLLEEVLIRMKRSG
jgi:glycosyltransferase involved in cell wall biosynthesis